MKSSRILFLLYFIFDFNKIIKSQNVSHSLENSLNLSFDFLFRPQLLKHVVMCPGCIDAFINYMKIQNINQVVISSCEEKHDKIKFNRLLIEAGLTAAYLNENLLEKTISRLFPERQQRGIYVNFQCRQTKTLFDLASKLELFDDICIWVVFTDDPVSTLSMLRTVNLNLHSHLIMIVNDSFGKHMAYDIYNLGFNKGAPLNVTFYGSYSSGHHKTTEVILNGLNPKYPKPLLLDAKKNYSNSMIDELFQNLELNSLAYITENDDHKWDIYQKDNWIKRRWSLEHEVVLVGAFCTVDKPKKGTIKNYIYSKEDVHRDTFTRMYFDMLDHIMEILQFDVKLRRTPNWGELVNGSWTGVLQMLTTGDADISLSPMSLKKNRVGVGDVGAYTCMARFPIMFRQPQTSTASLALFVYPLDVRCWLVALSMSIFAVLLTMFIMFKEIKFIGPNSENTDITVSNFVISMVCVLYQDGPERNPKLWSGRALLFVMLMFGYMITQFYSASLIGSILMEPPKQINNVKDLIDSNFYFRAEDVVYQRMFFKQHMGFKEVNGLYNKKLMQPVDDLPTFINVDEGLTRVKKGGFAFQTHAAYAYKEMLDWGDDIICEVDEILVYPLTRLYNMLRRGSPYRQHITTSMLLMSERGVQSYLNEKWFIKRPRCPPEHASRPRPVADQFYPALELLAAICGLSVLILLSEIMVARFRSSSLIPYLN